jgi:hypothetical protein
MTWLTGLNGPKLVPTKFAAKKLSDSVPAPPFRMALFPEAVELVAPAAPMPPNPRSWNAIVWVAVLVLGPMAVNVNVTFAGDECVNPPTMVPLVNGVVKTSGLSIPSVFVIWALDGKLE